MSPRDPQPGEKYRLRRNRWEPWQYLQVVQGQDDEYLQQETAYVWYQVVVQLLGEEPRWGVRPGPIQLRLWRLRCTQGNLEQLPDDWDIKDLPKPALTDTDRVVAAWHWAKSQPPSPAIQELLGILGEP